MAYFGTFDVDEFAKTVIHHVQACLVPSSVGTDLKRTYRFDANRLVLTATAATSMLEVGLGARGGLTPTLMHRATDPYLR
ncbi:MAG: lipocalin-like domain-containing protein [Bryobacteraceae bacterium]